ncbi:MAG: hypothetical protein ACE5Z5_05770 [Candidatus Bathyarchaeia archaeon]
MAEERPFPREREPIPWLPRWRDWFTRTDEQLEAIYDVLAEIRDLLAARPPAVAPPKAPPLPPAIERVRIAEERYREAVERSMEIIRKIRETETVEQLRELLEELTIEEVMVTQPQIVVELLAKMAELAEGMDDYYVVESTVVSGEPKFYDLEAEYLRRAARWGYIINDSNPNYSNIKVAINEKKEFTVKKGEVRDLRGLLTKKIEISTRDAEPVSYRLVVW